MGFSDAAEEISLKKSDVVFVSPDGENPTPKGLYMLSNLDQTFPYPIEIVFAFKKNINNNNNNNNNIDVAKVLKQSLAQVLQVYYPLIGGVDVSWGGKMMVDCGGGNGGVPFVEAFCDEEMAAAVGDNIALIDEKLKKFVYSNNTPYQTILDVPPLSVQVTTFKCGGVILGVGFNHILIDGRGFADFLINWSQIAKGFPLKTCPNLDRSIFSPNQSQQMIHISHPEYSKSKAPLIPTLNPKNQHKTILNKSFTFTPSNLAHLKKLALNNNNNNDDDNGHVSWAPTNFELISALVWTSWTRATQVGPDKTTQIITAVDGRPKLGPPLVPGYFGNGIVWSCARSKAQMLTSQPFSYAVGIARDAIKAVNEDYIRSAIDFHEVTRKPLEQENTLWITKWSRLPFYEADFGWGSADQVAPASLVDNLVVYLSQGRESGNLVISVRLPAEAMEVFEELIESHMN